MEQKQLVPDNPDEGLPKASQCFAKTRGFAPPKAERQEEGVIDAQESGRMSDVGQKTAMCGGAQGIRKERCEALVGTQERHPDGWAHVASTSTIHLPEANTASAGEKLQPRNIRSLEASHTSKHSGPPHQVYLHNLAQLKLAADPDDLRVSPDQQLAASIKDIQVGDLDCTNLMRCGTHLQPARASSVEARKSTTTRMIKEKDALISPVSHPYDGGRKSNEFDVLNRCGSLDSAYSSRVNQRGVKPSSQHAGGEETRSRLLSSDTVPLDASNDCKHENEKCAVIMQRSASEETPVPDASDSIAGLRRAIASDEPNVNKMSALVKPESPSLGNNLSVFVDRCEKSSSPNLSQMSNEEPYLKHTFLVAGETTNEQPEQPCSTRQPTAFCNATPPDHLALPEDLVTDIADLGIDEIQSAAELRSHLSGVYFHIPKREWRAVIGRGNRRQQKTFSVRKYGFYAAKRHAEHFRTQFDLTGYVYDSRRPPPLATTKGQGLSGTRNTSRKPEGYNHQTQEGAKTTMEKETAPSASVRGRRSTAHPGRWTMRGGQLSGSRHVAHTFATTPLMRNNQGDHLLLAHDQQPLGEESGDDSQFASAGASDGSPFPRLPALRTHDTGPGTPLRRRRGGRRGRRGSLSTTMRRRGIDTQKPSYQESSNMVRVSGTTLMPAPTMDLPDVHDAYADCVSQNPLKRRHISEHSRDSRTMVRLEGPISENGRYGCDNSGEARNRNNRNCEALGGVTQSLADEEARENSFDVVLAAEELLRALTLSLLSASPTTPEQNGNPGGNEDNEVATYRGVHEERDASNPDACLSDIINLMDLELNRKLVVPQNAVDKERLPGYGQRPAAEAEDGFEFHMRTLNPNEDAQLHVSGCPRGQVAKTHSTTLSQDSPDCLCPKVPLKTADQLLNTALGLGQQNATHSNPREGGLSIKNTLEDTSLASALKSLMDWSTSERCRTDLVYRSEIPDTSDVPKGSWDETSNLALSGNQSFPGAITATKSRSCPQLPTLMSKVEKWNNLVMPTALVAQSITAGREGCIK